MDLRPAGMQVGEQGQLDEGNWHHPRSYSHGTTAVAYIEICGVLSGVGEMLSSVWFSWCWLSGTPTSGLILCALGWISSIFLCEPDTRKWGPPHLAIPFLYRALFAGKLRSGSGDRVTQPLDLRLIALYLAYLICGSLALGFTLPAALLLAFLLSYDE